MVYFQTKKSNLSKFWTVLQWKISVYVMPIWSILHQIDIFMAVWYILRSFGLFDSLFGMLYPKKSGNPALDAFA
jgi:hypothetical protein